MKTLKNYGEKHSRLSPQGIASLRIHSDGAISNGLYIIEKYNNAKESAHALSSQGWSIQGDVARYKSQTDRA